MIFRHNQAKPRPRIKAKFTVMANQSGHRNRRHEVHTADRRSFIFILFLCIGISTDFDSIEDIHREKRQLENFDDEYPTATSQHEEEEPGFWDRIVKVALKLFSKFVEWLNS
ncbi:hypothetical protein HW555_007222 [Spodoptera exigua]|uniref:Uncharacterized protein n=2 Tax=Spodoptera exigua TaxID=7107 RepID=A0A835GGB7_SPOEX|nr:hypothetical protein HW555_007222 [Spodoptera exigua]